MLKQIKGIADKIIGAAARATTGAFPVTEQVVRPARLLAQQVPPRNIVSLPPAVQQWFGEQVKLPEQLVYRFQDVRVSWHGVVLHQLQLFVPSLAYPIYQQEFAGVFLLRQWLAKSTVVRHTVALPYDHWAANNYYHWLVDTLPRMLLLREKHPGCTLLLPSPARDYVTLTAAALGFKVVQAIPTGEFIQAHDVLMPSHVAPPGKQDPTLMRLTRAELISSLGTTMQVGQPVQKRVYVSRNRQSLRRLANEDAVLPLLAAHHIAVVYFEEMSFTQQVQLMQHVELLVGLHGANLTNLLFMPAGAKVVELFNQEVCNLCYFHLASNLELEYYGVPCTPIIGSSPVDIPNGDDVVVDIDFLKKALDSVAA